MLPGVQQYVYARNADDRYRFFKYQYGPNKTVTNAFGFKSAIDSDLVEAILRGNLAKVQVAVGLKADVKAKEDRAETRTPIMFAALQTNTAIVDTLVNNGANVCEVAFSFGHASGGLYTSVNINNAPIAKAMLQHVSQGSLEKQQWYSGMPQDFKNRVIELRAEIDKPELERANAANRVLYRLKYGCALAAGILAPVAGGALLGFSATPIIWTTAAVAVVLVAYDYIHGKGHTPKAEDLKNGFEILWSEGLKSTIAKFYNSPKYGSSYLYQDYCYSPVGVVTGSGLPGGVDLIR